MGVDSINSRGSQSSCVGGNPLPDDFFIVNFSQYLSGNPSDANNTLHPAGQANAYNQVNAIKTIVDRRAQAYGGGKVWVLDNEGNEGKDIEASGVRKLLRNPNPLQTWEQFYIQQKIYKIVFGFCPVYKLQGSSLSLPKALYNILPSIFEIKTSRKLYNQTEKSDIIESYGIKYFGAEYAVSTEDIMLVVDTGSSLSVDKLTPNSRLAGLRFEIATSALCSEAKYSIIDNRGALGALTPTGRDGVGETTPLTAGEKESILNRFKRRFGLRHEQSAVIIADKELKWVPIGLPTKDLQLLEISEDAKRTIADAIDYPFEMLSSAVGVTYENKAQAKKQFYQDIVMPEAKSDSEAFTHFLGLKNSRIEIDFSDTPILQEDRRLRAQTMHLTANAVLSLVDKGIVTIEEARLELGEIMRIDPSKII